MRIIENKSFPLLRIEIFNLKDVGLFRGLSEGKRGVEFHLTSEPPTRYGLHLLTDYSQPHSIFCGNRII